MSLVDPHLHVYAAAFVTTFPRPLGEFQAEILSRPAEMEADDAVRTAVRDLLRRGGFKPTGRAKPASEYLRGHPVGPINVAVDVGNLVSLHSGLPISVIDLDLAKSPVFVGLAPKGAAYVFNAAGQEMDLGGLLCLFDADGPCANAVKDSQRTKTHAGTTRTLTIIWSYEGARGEQALRWARRILDELGTTTDTVAMSYRA